MQRMILLERETWSKEEEFHLRVLKFSTIAIGLENTEDLLILHVIFN